MDLTVLRDGLGMSAVKPQPPSCIESIMKDSQISATIESNQVPASFESTLPLLDLDDEPADLSGTPQPVSLEEIALEGAEIKFHDSEIMFDESKPSFSPVGAKSGHTQAEVPSAHEPIELDIDFLLDETELPPLSTEGSGFQHSAIKSAETLASQQNAEDDLVIEISEDDLQSLLTDLEEAPSEKMGKKI
jgi:hypothetical protein